MPSDSSSSLKFEIGHVLFIDIVGYSKLLISEQSELLKTLKEIVRGTEQVRLAQAEGKLLPLPTGGRRRACFSDQPGGAGPVRAGNQPGTEESSRAAGAHGDSQRPG